MLSGHNLYHLVRRSTNERMGIAFIKVGERIDASENVIVEDLKVCGEQISRPVEKSCNFSGALTTTLHKPIKKECPDTLVKDQLKTENTSMNSSKKSSRKRASVKDADTLKQLKANRRKELNKPGEMGWKREILYCKEEHITGKYITCITYVSPPDPGTGVSKEFNRTAKDVQTYLDSIGDTKLSGAVNFTFARIELGVSWEIVRSRKKNKYNPASKPSLASLYKQFYTELEDTQHDTGYIDRTRYVSCKLCNGLHVRFNMFTKHMRKLHLPDETCPRCLQNFSAGEIRTHRRKCKFVVKTAWIGDTTTKTDCRKEQPTSNVVAAKELRDPASMKTECQDLLKFDRYK